MKNLGKISKALERAKNERKIAKKEEIQPVKDTTAAARSIAGGAQFSGSKRENFAELIKASVDYSHVDKRVVVHHDPDSYITEQYRMMRTNLNSAKGDKHPKVLLISSSMAEEGKSLTAVNYAHTLASDPTKKVLLVDCDLRKGTLASYFGHQAQNGITTYLQEKIEFVDALTKTQYANLHVVFRGERIENPVEMLDSARMKKFLKEADRLYDYIVIDAPPILPITDAAVLAAEADGLVLVVRLGKTPKHAVRQSIELFRQAKTPVLGLVATHVDFARAYGYQGYYYYSYN